MEKLAHYVDKEEKIWVKFIVSAHVLERISQAECLCEAEKSMKVHFSCICLLFGLLSKEVARTRYKSGHVIVFTMWCSLASQKGGF